MESNYEIEAKMVMPILCTHRECRKFHRCSGNSGNNHNPDLLIKVKGDLHYLYCLDFEELKKDG